jgi:hypothetical protein
MWLCRCLKRCVEKHVLKASCAACFVLSYALIGVPLRFNFATTLPENLNFLVFQKPPAELRAASWLASFMVRTRGKESRFLRWGWTEIPEAERGAYLAWKLSGMAVGYEWMIGGSIPGRGCEFFSPPPRPDRLWGSTQPRIQWVPGTISLGVKRPGREADHSPPSSAEVKNAWSYISVFMLWFSVFQSFLDRRREDSRLNWMVATILRIWSALSFFVNAISIRYCRCQTLELRHIYEACH